jgi:undecaprenyl diphosphate synthase
MISEAEFLVDPRKVETIKRCYMDFFSIKRIIFHISSKNQSSLEKKISSLKFLENTTSIYLSTPSGDINSDAGTPESRVVLGHSGRNEIKQTIVAIALEGIDPEIITEETIEPYLLYQANPDITIKTDGNYLNDFLIWRSVYSELLFTDINWCKFRRLDLRRIFVTISREFVVTGRNR